MVTMKFRQLIDMAIGSPDPGHVNFYALHCLLNCIAEKLNIIDDSIDFTQYAKMIHSSSSKTNFDYEKFVYENYRLGGGADDVAEEAGGGGEAPPAEESPPADAGGDESAPPGAVEEPQQPPEPAEAVAESPEVVADAPASVSEPIVEEPPAPEPQISITTEAEPEAVVEEPLPSVSPSDDMTLDIEAPAGARAEQQSVVVTSIKDQQLVATPITTTLPTELLQGIKNISFQMDAVMEQLLLATYILLTKTSIPELFQELYELSQRMRAIRKENLSRLQTEDPSRELKAMPSLVWSESMLHPEGGWMPCDITDPQSAGATELEAEEAPGPDITEGHLCYSNERLMDELLDLKSELCQLINKVNELSAKVLQQESQQTVRYIKELQEQMKECKNLISILKTQVEADGLNITLLNGNTDRMQKSIEELRSEKVDKTELDILLSDKVDYGQLQRKVSLDQLLELQCRMDKRLCEVGRVIAENDAAIRRTIEDLENTLGFASIEGILNKFRDQIEEKINNIQTLLQKYIDSTNDECAAAGARVKVLQDVTCLSCETNCVMRSMEKSKVAKMPNAHASNLLSPVITYELGTIRKSGVMGYYRKDDFPHAPNAWMGRKNNNLPMKQCVQRHAGGPHTTHTAKERVAKLSTSKK